jgi:hypothetical protein
MVHEQLRSALSCAPLICFSVEEILGNLVNIKLRVMDADPSKGKLGSNKQPKFHKLVDFLDCFEFFPQLGEVLKLMISRKHDLVNSHQGILTRFREFFNLQDSALQLDNGQASFRLCPEDTT